LGVSRDAGIYKRQIEPSARKIIGLQSAVFGALGSFLSITQRKRVFLSIFGVFLRLLSKELLDFDNGGGGIVNTVKFGVQEAQMRLFCGNSAKNSKNLHTQKYTVFTIFYQAIFTFFLFFFVGENHLKIKWSKTPSRENLNRAVSS